MKSLKDYLAEAEYILENPVPGDHFDIEVDSDTVIETIVTELGSNGEVIIALDEHAIQLLSRAGHLLENSLMPSPEDSTSPIDGHTSPINGSAFAPYHRKHDPREWFRKDVKHDEDEDLGSDPVTMSGVSVNEAEYHGHKVQLGKKMAGDVKKSKVYVRKPNGNIVKVNFGDKTMRIKKNNPARRRSYRARHHCENPGPRWKANYWSCRSW
jgi:hypothetical protein